MGMWGILRGVGCALLVVLALGTAGCGGEEQAAAPSEGAEPARMMRTGARIFAEHCRTCHPLLGRPNDAIHDDFHPPLDLDQVSPSEAYARRVVEIGLVGMGGFGSTLSDAEQDAVVEYVLEVGGGEVDAPAGVTEADLARGRRVYDKYCQSCHQIAGRVPTDPNPIWTATNFDELRPGILWTEDIVREGMLGAMPPLKSRISKSGIRAVAVYVNAVARGGLRDDGP